MRHVALDVRGLDASGCVQRIEELFRREPGRQEMAIRPSLSRIDLWVARGFRIDRFVAGVEDGGCRVGPAADRRLTVRSRPGARGSVSRLGCCAALAAASVLLVRATGGGAHAAAGVALLGALSLWASAPLFARAAWRALRRGRLVPELTAAAGLACACAAATWSALRGESTGAALVVALCAGGRTLESWLLDRAARRQLAGQPADGVVCRRIRDGRVEMVGCGRVRRADELVIAPGELVPVEAMRLPGGDADALVAPDREPGAAGASDVRTEPGACVPAGTRNAGDRAVRVAATRPFSLAALRGLPAAPGEGSHADRAAGSARRGVGWCASTARDAVGLALVLLMAAVAGALVWLAAGRGAGALDVAAAVLIAWPPAAFAVARARQSVEARLRRQGLLIRRDDFLERARRVRRIAIDENALVDVDAPLRLPELLARLSAGERAALHHLAVHSPHPRCGAVRRALAGEGSFPLLDAEVREVSGRGVEAVIEGALYRLGAPRWAVQRGASPAAGLGFSRDGRLLAWLVADQALRATAGAELAELAALGVEPWLLSAADSDRVAAIARRLDIPSERARGRMQPGDKTAWLAEHGGDMLFLGDGVNDGAAGEAALASGTPAAGRPLVAAASDFHLVAPRLAPVAAALAAARDLGRTTRRLHIAADVLAGAAVLLALAGLAPALAIAAATPAASLALAVAPLSSARPRAQPVADYSPIGRARVSHSPV